VDGLNGARNVEPGKSAAHSNGGISQKCVPSRAGANMISLDAYLTDRPVNHGNTGRLLRLHANLVN
jgi:hypothetical protein